jgi:hypothetical protein
LKLPVNRFQNLASPEPPGKMTWTGVNTVLTIRNPDKNQLVLLAGRFYQGREVYEIIIPHRTRIE